MTGTTKEPFVVEKIQCPHMRRVKDALLVEGRRLTWSTES